MQDVTVSRLYRVQDYRLPSPPSFKCNVLPESLSVDSQNIPCAILKRRGSWVISISRMQLYSISSQGLKHNVTISPRVKCPKC
jgi:hypothetical protein